MKKLFLIAVVVLYPSVSFACMVGEDWTNKTRARFDKIDSNKDGKLEKEEFMQQKKKTEKLEKEWKADKLTQKGYITKDEFVRRAHPKCIEIKS